MVRRLAAAALGVVIFGLTAGVVAATVSPVGLWKGQNDRTYRWTALPGGGYAEYVMTSHRTATDHCLVKPNTLVYRYHPAGGGIFRVDSLIWEHDCTAHWSLADETMKIVVTATRMTESCDKAYMKVCFTYTRPGDTQAPKVRALDSTGTVGGVTALRYIVSDNSGRSWEALSIYRDGVVARHYRTPLGPSRGALYGYRLLQTPASFRGVFRFCVQSHDAAGNVSTPSCAKVRIR